jgi:TonB-dependent SusC/RagA subfamily outer membrane receptor
MLSSSQKSSGRALLPLTLLAGILVGLLSGCARSTATGEAEPEVAPRQDSTSASTLTSGEAPKRDPREPIESVLARRYPGVDVSRIADGTLRIRMRGTASFYGSSEPLIVIDGVPLASGHGGRLAGINPYYIESIEVLRHPPETTLYGVRGANGVILVTTKQPDITRPDDYDKLPIHVGTPQESPTILTRADWQPTLPVPWAHPEANGFWNLEAVAGDYDITLHFPQWFEAGTITLVVGVERYSAISSPGSRLHTFESIVLAQGPVLLLAMLDDGGVMCGPWEVEVRWHWDN